MSEAATAAAAVLILSLHGLSWMALFLKGSRDGKGSVSWVEVVGMLG